MRTILFTFFVMICLSLQTFSQQLGNDSGIRVESKTLPKSFHEGVTLKLQDDNQKEKYYNKLNDKKLLEETGGFESQNLEEPNTNKNILAPSNDNCAGAITLTPGNCTPTVGDVTGATQSQAGCAGTANDDIWYKFVATSTVHDVDVYPSANFDAVLEFFSGNNCSSLSSITCADAGLAGEFEGVRIYGLTIGNTYYVRVYDYYSGTPATTTFEISVDKPYALNATLNNTTITECCTKLYDSGKTSDYSNSEDYKVTYQTTAGNRIRLQFYEFSVEDTYDYLYIYDGPNTSSTLLFTWTGSPTYLPDAVSSGQYLTVRFKSDNIITDAGFVLNVLCEVIPPAPGLCNGNTPASDNCAVATQICDPDGYCGNTSSYFTPDLPGNMCSGCTLFGGSIENNSWISFTAAATTATLQFDVSNCSDALGIQFGIYSGSGCSGFALLTDADKTTSGQLGSQTITATGLTIGSTYYIMVDGFAGDVCDYTITVIDGIMTGEVTGNASVCYGSLGEVYTMNATATGYNWTVPAGASITSGSGTNTITVNWGTASSGNVSCSATAGACAGAASNLAVTVTTPATASISYSQAAYCKGDGAQSINLTGTGSYTTGSYSAPAGLTLNTSTGAITPSTSTAGTYTVTYTIPATGGCNQITTTTSVKINSAITSTSSVTNVDCFGNTTGSATVTPSGGTPGYTYLWNTSPSQSSATASNLPAGTYTVTITDNIGCTSTKTVTVTEPTVLSATVTNTNVNCNGGNNGTATVSPSGGTAGYTYSWNSTPVQSGATANNLPAGTYTVTVTDSKSCTLTKTVTVTEPQVLTSTLNATDASCYGSANGTITATPSGGTSPYNYAWNDPSFQTTQTASGLASGTYTVTITDSKSCTTTISEVIDQPTAIVLSTSTTNSSCGGSDGTATVNVTGGTSPYTYQWGAGTGNQTTQTAINLASGSYNVTVTDLNSCTSNTNVNVSDNAAPTASIAASSNVACNGGTDGWAVVTATGGTPPFTYLWSSGGVTNDTISGIPSGTYSVTATDNFGCNSTASVTITQPTVLNAVITNTTNIDCYNNCNGSVTVSVSGGSSPYTYVWDDAGNQTSPTAINLCAANYNVTVSDSHGCTDNATSSVTQPAQLTTSITSSTNTTGFGICDGMATVTPVGGVSPYQFIWDDPSSQSLSTASNLCANNYTVTVTDLNGCTTTAFVTITEPQALQATISSATNVDCNGNCNGAATVSVTGGLTPYSYTWDDANNTTTETVSGLCVGTYNVTVTDNNSISTSVSVTITEPAALGITTSGTDALCFENSDGTAQATVSGGVTPYTYLWDNLALSTTASINNLPMGTYHVTATDANNCTITSSVVIDHPDSISINVASITNATCGGNDGSITVAVTGGSSPYTFLWDSNASNQTTETASTLYYGDYNVTVTDAHSCNNTLTATVQNLNGGTASLSIGNYISCNGGSDGQAITHMSGGTSPFTYAWSNGADTQIADLLAAGFYDVTVTDANGCLAIADITLTEPTAVTVTTSVLDNVSCNGGNDGSAQASATGGTSPYTYEWSTTPAQTTAIATGLQAGTYTVTAYDTNGCTNTTTVSITQPTILAVTTVVTNALCNGSCDGQADANPTGGVAPYTYNWDNTQTTEVVTGLCAGDYNVTVTDVNGCTATTMSTVSEPTLISLTMNSVAANCGNADGSASVSASGGTPSYSYHWSNNGNTATITGITAGNYLVTVTDLNSCTVTSSVSVSDIEAPTSSITNTIHVSCNGGNDGSATVTATGGVSPYTYLWTNNQTSNVATGLSAGTYSVTVTASNGCTTTSTVSITEPSAILGVITQNNVSCNGSTDGTAQITVSGGTSGYTYLWNDPANSTGTSVTNLSATGYQVTITDANNCTSIVPFTITQPQKLIINTSTVDVICKNGSDGAATALPSGGTAPYSYSWSSGGNQSTELGLTEGQYYISVTDSKGCFALDSVVIGSPLNTLSFEVSSEDASCFDGNDGTASIYNITGGTSPYSYAWSANDQITQTAVNLHAGNYYTATVTDANNCSAVKIVHILSPSQMYVVDSLTIITNTSCESSEDGSIEMSVAGGTPTYTYDWVNGKTGYFITDLAAGEYMVTITDMNGCTITDTLTVENTNEPCLEIPTAFTPNGDGFNDTWVIKHIDLFPDCVVEIYNRWGIKVYSMKGYNNDWNGTTESGKEAPMGSYIFIINLNNNTDPITGTVSIIR